MSNRYIERLMDAIKQSSQINWVYICAFQSQNGFVAKMHFAFSGIIADQECKRAQAPPESD